VGHNLDWNEQIVCIILHEFIVYVIPVGFIFTGSHVAIIQIIIVKHDNVKSGRHLVHQNFIGIQHLKEMVEPVYLDVFQYLFDKMFGVFTIGD
jgi:hypothetical protein